MPISFSGFDINRGLEAGKTLMGEGPQTGIGMAIKNLTDRAKQVRDLELKKKYAVGEALEIEEGKGEIRSRQTAERMRKFFVEGGMGGGMSEGQGTSQPRLQSYTVDPSTGKMYMRFGSRTPPSAQVSAVNATQQSIDRLKEVIAMQEKKKFGTGPTSLRFQRGTPANLYAQWVGTPEELDFKKKNERFVNAYLTAQTGAQRGMKEVEWLAPTVPNVATDRPDVYLNSAYSALAELESNLQRQKDYLNSAGYQNMQGSEGTVGDDIDSDIDAIMEEKGIPLE